MAEIDSLGNNFYYAGLQNSSSHLKNQKADKSQKTTKSRFSALANFMENRPLKPYKPMITKPIQETN